ncbi:uncharacterized protein LOC115215717 [Argonauta hians]
MCRQVQTVLVLAVLVLVTEGFFFNKERDPDSIVQHPNAEITDECLQFAETGDCRIYHCVEQRFPCGRKGYAHNIGMFYCPRVEGFRKNFDDKGREWLESTNRCQIQAMKAVYQMKGASCDQISAEAFKIQEKCYVNNDFCDIGWSNRQALWDMYKPSDLLPASPHFSGLWKNVGKISTKCISEKAKDFTDWVKSHEKTVDSLKDSLKEKVNKMWDKVKNWFD